MPYGVAVFLKSLDSAFKGDKIIAIDDCKKLISMSTFKLGTMMGIQGVRLRLYYLMRVFMADIYRRLIYLNY